MSVTIYEIAERAGVSSSTVARILRGDVRGIAPTQRRTAQRIQRLAREMGYRPNLRARAFSRGRTHGIGLLYTDDAWIFEGVNTEVVNSLVRALQRENYHLVFAPIDDGRRLGRNCAGRANRRRRGVSAAARQSQRGGPRAAVAAGAIGRRQRSERVASDRRRLRRRLRRDKTSDWAGASPRDAVCARIGEAALQYPGTAQRLSHGDGRGGACHERMCAGVGRGSDRLLVRGDERPTGVICYSDLESTLLVHALWQYGLAIPGDVSLIGFNDVFATRYMTPPLTTVGFDAAKIGELGAQLLLKEIDASAEEREPTVLTVKPRLIVRGSTSAPGVREASTVNGNG